jgi:lipoate-protein ligase A
MGEDSPDTIVLCRPDAPYFSVGHHQAPHEELDLDWCRAEGYPVIQRRIGGGTVFLDWSQLFYQCVFHRRRAPLMVEAIYRRFLGPVVETLRALGLPADLAGANEIEVAGRRMAGTGGGQIGEAVVVVGNLLFDFPVAVMSRAWRVPSAAFRRLAEDGLRRHLATLRALLPATPSEAELGALLVRCYAAGLGRPLVPGRLAREEEEAVLREEAHLAKSGMALPRGRDRRDRLKLTRRVWIREWTGSGASEAVRLTARLADGRIEALALGDAADGVEGERRPLEARDR